MRLTTASSSFFMVGTAAILRSNSREFPRKFFEQKDIFTSGFNAKSCNRTEIFRQQINMATSIAARRVSFGRIALLKQSFQVDRYSINLFPSRFIFFRGRLVIYSLSIQTGL